LYRDAAVTRVSSAEPLDELVTLPTIGWRAVLIALVLILVIGIAAWIWLTTKGVPARA
jgi:hypothetical protein